MIKMGSWWLKSKLDPRWNAAGRCYCGGFVMPEECKDKLEELKNQLGNPPTDLSFGYMKD